MFTYLYLLFISNLKTEIADLKSEKEYLQSRCCNLENGKLLPSTSKVFKYLIRYFLMHTFLNKIICVISVSDQNQNKK